MIEKVTLDNFKNHAHTEIELGRVTALVGPNGCGKTSVLQAVQVLNQFVWQYVEDLHQDWQTIHQFTRRGQSQENVGISVFGSNSSWKVGISGARTLIPSIISDDALNAFGHVIYFRGIAAQLALPSAPLEIPPKLAADGSGLAPVMVNLMTSDRGRRKQIERTLSALVPTVEEINARPVTLKRKEKKVFAVNGAQFPYEEEHDVQGSELIFKTASGNEIPAQEMSEGTLLTVGLLTLLHSSAPDVRLFLLDDVEQGLHPLAQRKLMQILKEFAQQHDRQIILTTHSPYIVDELDANDVWVMATDNAGISHCKRLSDHPNIDYALSVLTTGEIWGAEGEEWVLNGSVPAEITANA